MISKTQSSKSPFRDLVASFAAHLTDGDEK